MKLNTLLFSICLVFTVNLQTTAQKNTTDSLLTVELEEVEISAFRAKTSVLNAPVSLSVAQIPANWSGPSRSLQEYLTNIPGVLTLNSSNYAQDLRISMRGFGARAAFGIRGIKLVVDGIPETTPDGQGQLDNLPLSLIREISVIRGPSALRYGNASGGVIAINTLSPGGEKLNSVSLLTGGFGQRQVSTTQDFGTENNSYLLHYTHQKINGYRAHSEAENNIFNFRSKHKISEKTNLNIQLNHTSSPVARDAGGLTLEEFESEPIQARALNVNYNAGERLTHSKLGLSLNGTIERGIEYNAYGFISSRDFDALLPFTNGGAVSLERTYGGQGSSFTFQTTNLKWQLGYDWASQKDLRERFANNRGTRGEQSLNQYEKFEGLGGYLIAHWRLGSLLLNGGLRYDKNKLSLEDQFLGDGNDSSKIQLNALNPQLSFAYNATNHLSIYGGYALGYETPTLSELSANPTGEGGFNQNLNIQKANQVEFGLRYSDSKITGSVVWYHINTQDDILPYESASFPSQTLYQNVGTTKRSGLELNGQWKVWPETLLSANYTLINARFTNGNIKEKYLPGIAEDFGSLQLQQNLNKNASIRFISIYRGSIYADNDNTVTIPKNIVFSLEATKGFNSIHFTAGIQNLLNAQYSDNVRINGFGARYYEAAIARQGFIRIRYQL
jgi:iron complex outermembrane receptor protein